MVYLPTPAHCLSIKPLPGWIIAFSPEKQFGKGIVPRAELSISTKRSRRGSILSGKALT